MDKKPTRFDNRGIQHKAGMAQRLSIFQKTMLLWNRLHAYNAVHIAEVPGRFDQDLLQSAIDEVLQISGLTGLRLDEESYRYEFRGGKPETPVKVIQPGLSLQSALREEVQSQLNTPFPIDRPFTPFRCFVLPQEGSFYLGLAYCHFICDAIPVVLLLTSVIKSYQGQDGKDELKQLNLYPRMFRRLWPTMARHLPYWIAQYPKFLCNLSESIKPRYAERTDGTNAFSMRQLPMGQVRGSLTAAKSWGVTFNDLLLAALAKAISPVVIEIRKRRQKRGRIALSSIMDVRGDASDNSAYDVGVFLGNFLTFHSHRPEDALQQRCRHVSPQTRQVKKHKLHLRTMLDLKLSNIFMPLFSPPRQQKIYVQKYPVLAGISNLRMDSLAMCPTKELAGQYIRAVSTGPVCPLTLSVTTFGETFTVSASHRTTSYTSGQVQDIMDRFIQCIRDPKNS